MKRVRKPIPYVALDANHLGKTSPRRTVEVARDRLCQVCGLAVGNPALAVMSTDPTWEPEWVLDHGLLHEECFRLALAQCPGLTPWQDR